MYFDKAPHEILQCSVCGDDTTLHCMRCHKPYCSKACQRLDWNGVGSAETKQKAEAYQKAQACQKAGSKKKRYGDHKVVCYKLAGPYNAAFVQLLTTPPPRPPSPPSQAGRRDFEPPAAQPVSPFIPLVVAPFFD